MLSDALKALESSIRAGLTYDNSKDRIILSLNENVVSGK
jgi:hypothetical protein